MHLGFTNATLLAMLLTGCATFKPPSASPSVPTARLRIAGDGSVVQVSGGGDFNGGKDLVIVLGQQTVWSSTKNTSIGIPTPPAPNPNLYYNEIAVPGGIAMAFKWDVPVVQGLGLGPAIANVLNSCPVEFSFSFQAGVDYEVEYHRRFKGGFQHHTHCDITVAQISDGEFHPLARFVPTNPDLVLDRKEYDAWNKEAFPGYK